ncbi:MAG: 23S rRNA (pseudouridine(1915)-N(3))-methyltransferase RlmH [Coriobacteriia bacterium]
MKIVIAAVGKLKERHYRDAAAEYLKRLRPYAAIEILEAPDQDLSQGDDRARRTEAEALERLVPAGARLIALDAGGRQFSSEGFSQHLAEIMHSGQGAVAFIVGGSAGIDPQLLARADERMSLGPMTLPHQLARVVLLEQVYRAFRIMRNEPYHR